MDKIPIWMDLIAGVLLIMDLIPRDSRFGKIHSWMRKILTEIDTNNPGNPKTMVFNLLGAIFAFFALLSWAWYRSSGEQVNIWPEIRLLFIGILIGAIVINSIAILFKKVFGDGFSFATFVTGIILSIVFLVVGIYLNKAPTFITALIALVYMCILIPFTILISNHVRKILLGNDKIRKEKPFYMFALLGAAIFIISKVILLAV